MPGVEGQPLAMLALARQMRAAGREDLALDLGGRAKALAPGDGEVRTRAAELLSDGVPGWHFVIVQDRLRNQAYDTALRRAVFQGCKVLEIGTGTGLLAMMAARAGAAQVITCDSDAAVAAAARDVIAANGYADRVRVVDKHSSDLDVEADLGGPVDVLVSEIVSNDLLSEGVLPAHKHALEALLKPGAAVIPARGRVRIALAEDSAWRRGRMGVVEGLDLSAFDRLAKPNREIPVGSPRLRLRSAPFDLFAFDFAAASWPDRRAEARLDSHGGSVNGVAQWIALEMDDAILYENRPGGGASSCWAAVFWPFEQPIDTAPGQILTVGARHGQDRIWIWLER